MNRVSSLLNAAAFVALQGIALQIGLAAAPISESVPTSERSSRPVGYALGIVEYMGEEYQIYSVPGNPDQVTYVAPYQFVTDDNDASVSVQIDDAKENPFNNKSGLSRVTITLRRPGQAARAAIAKKLNESGIRARMSSAPVIPAEIHYLKVEDVTPNAPEALRFGTYECYNPSAREIALHAFVPQAQAKDFEKWVKGGNVFLRMTQKLYGETIVSQMSFNIEGKAIQMFEKELKLEGTATAPDLQNGKTATVDRFGGDKVKSRMMRALAVSINQMGTPKDDGYLSTLFDSIFAQMIEEGILYFEAEEEWEDLTGSFYELSGLDKGRVDAIRNEMRSKSEQEIADIMKKSWDKARTVEQEKSGEGSFKGDFGMKGLGMKSHGTAKGKYIWNESKSDSGETERSKTEHTLEEKGVIYEMRGDLKVPVGIRIFRVSQGDIQERKAIALSSTTTEQSLKSITFDVSTKQQSAWRVKSYRFVAYPKDKAATVLESFAKAKDGTLKEVPLFVDRSDKSPIQQVPLQKGAASAIGERIEGPQVSEDRFILASVVLLSDTGETVFQQLLFMENLDGEVHQVDPAGAHKSLKFFLMDKRLYVQLRDTTEAPMPLPQFDVPKAATAPVSK